MHPNIETLPRGTRLQVCAGESIVRPSMDFETYSEAGFYLDHENKIRGRGPSGKGGLPVVGTPAYACDPSTDILCLYYDLKDGQGRRGWFPGTPNPHDLLHHIAQGGEIEAFNVTFEWWVWNAVGIRRYGWPELLIDQCYCVMAKSRRYSIAGGLANVSRVLGTPEKDKAGGRLIQNLTRPLTPTKNRPAIRWTPATAWDDFQAMYRYCDGDVRAEDHAAARIPDLTPQELDVWRMDQHINIRGVQVDTDALAAMRRVLDQAETKYNAELADLTGGQVQAATELAKLQDWLAGTGVHMPNMQADTIKDALGGYALRPAARRALEIRQLLGSANIKKLLTLSLQVSHDGRLRDQYTYCGADRTGRWSAGGVQLQNLVAKGPAAVRCRACEAVCGEAAYAQACPRCGVWAEGVDPAEWDAEYAMPDILSGDLATVERYWGPAVIEVLCGCLRALFIAPPGSDLVCVDFAAIEAVVAACLARCQWRIDVFSTHGKIYETSAANATGIPLQEILDYPAAHDGAHHPARKTIGKVRELAGGYGSWVNGWKAFGADAFMTDDEIKADVLKWRAESPEIVDMWGGQYRHVGPGNWDYRPELFGLEGMAISAILSPGQVFSYNDIAYAVWDDILHCRLPSGRCLYYWRPRLDIVADRLGRGNAYQITFEGYNSNPLKGRIGWARLETYGGSLFENVTQATARDFQAEAMLRCEATGYYVVMHSHDEVCAEVPQGFGSVEHMIAVMTHRPEWAQWYPIRGAGWRGKRYRKD